MTIHIRLHHSNDRSRCSSLENLERNKIKKITRAKRSMHFVAMPFVCVPCMSNFVGLYWHAGEIRKCNSLDFLDLVMGSRLYLPQVFDKKEDIEICLAWQSSSDCRF